MKKSSIYLKADIETPNDTNPQALVYTSNFHPHYHHQFFGVYVRVVFVGNTGTERKWCGVLQGNKRRHTNIGSYYSFHLFRFEHITTYKLHSTHNIIR